MDIMLDLETLSSRPDACIASIGACTFATDGTNTALQGRKTFYQIIDTQSSQRLGGRIDASTVKWWMEQSAGARSIFNFAGAVDIETALSMFSEFCRGFESVNIWGNGASFDNVVLRQAYERYGVPAPWSFRGDRCYRTLKNLRPDVEFVNFGTAHDAIDDAIAQAQHAEMIFAAMKGGVA